MMMARGRALRDNGFALLVVLWSLVLLGLLITQILGSGRTSLALAGNLRAATQAQAAADGAIYEAIYHFAASGREHWAADGGIHILGSSMLPISVRITSLSGKINPNLASPKLLAGLFEAVGSSSQQAVKVASAIVDWRNPVTSLQAQARLAAYQDAGLPYAPQGRPFSDLHDLGFVTGMTPALLAKSLPYMSLFQSGDPDPAQADPTVRHALALSNQAKTKNTASNNAGANINADKPVIMIKAVAGVATEVTVQREAVVSFSGMQGKLPFQTLSLTGGY